MQAPSWREDVEEIEALIGRIVAECPRRQATSASERRAQEILRESFLAAGLRTTWHPFRFNRSLYEVLALHFGLGALGNAVGLVAPPLGAALHGAAALSYWQDSGYRRYLLRRLLPFRPSQNLIATLPAKTPPALRIVFLGHVDAAFTGWVFHPKVIERFARKQPPPFGFLERSLSLATRAEAALAASNLLRTVLGPFGLPLLPLEALLAVPGLLTFLLNAQIVLRDEVVPGVADNLTGAAALPVLAQRLARQQRPDVELVFVATGCEEAGLGGAAALTRDLRAEWAPERTVVLALDTLSNGQLHYLTAEGEVVERRTPAWLVQIAADLAARDPRFRDVAGYVPPVGASDALPFLVRGWPAMCVTCIDPALGSAREYHSPTDTLENLDRAQLRHSLEFVEALTEAIVADRLGPARGGAPRS